MAAEYAASPFLVTSTKKATSHLGAFLPFYSAAGGWCEQVNRSAKPACQIPRCAARRPFAPNFRFTKIEERAMRNTSISRRGVTILLIPFRRYASWLFYRN